MKKFLLPLALLVFAGFLAVFPVIAHNLMESRPQIGAKDKPLPAFSTEGLASIDIDGPALINFFASWCIPCEAEHSVITDLARDVPVYGVAFMDKPEKIEAFFKRLGNPYRAVGRDLDGTAGANLGIRGVPTSIIIDEDNIIVYRHDAPLTPAEAEKIRRLLQP